ncbi:MAG: ROK family protein [Eubacteriaceae bacterium]
MGIGIDLGGTSIKGGLVDATGKILKEVACPTRVSLGYTAILEDICHLVKELMDFSKNEETQVGIGVPGILSKDSQSILNCPNLQLKNVSLKADLEKKLDLEVFLVNDATAACIAEAAHGSSYGKNNSVMLTLGTGVGGGVIINNQVITGAHGVASEVGHMLVGKNFYACGCGKNGCLETFSSATALVRFCRMGIEEGENSLLKDQENFDAKAIFEAGKEGDLLALSGINRLANYLGLAISNINDLIDPDIFVIGGGLSYAGDFLLHKIQKAVKENLTYPEIAKPEIVLATFKNEAGIIGAANIYKF